MSDDAPDTRHDAYADRLVRLGEARWKRVLNVQAPYRWNLRRLGLGVTLEVGSGTGRNLAGLAPGSVGVDHNAKSVEIARARGLDAFTVAEFHAQFADRLGAFDSSCWRTSPNTWSSTPRSSSLRSTGHTCTRRRRSH